MKEKIIERLEWSGLTILKDSSDDEIKFSGRLTGTILSDLVDFGIKFLEADSKGVFIASL